MGEGRRGGVGTMTPEQKFIKMVQAMTGEVSPPPPALDADEWLKAMNTLTWLQMQQEKQKESK